MNNETKITLETFLFGGSYKAMQIGAFNSFTEFAEETFESFDSFKDTVENLLMNYGFSEEHMQVTDAEQSSYTFDFPKDSILKKWFEKYGERV